MEKWCASYSQFSVVRSCFHSFSSRSTAFAAILRRRARISHDKSTARSIAGPISDEQPEASGQRDGHAAPAAAAATGGAASDPCKAAHRDG